MTTDLNDAALVAWERTQPDAITKDPLWTLNCYRESLFLIDAVREDAAKLAPQAPLSEPAPERSTRGNPPDSSLIVPLTPH